MAPYDSCPGHQASVKGDDATECWKDKNEKKKKNKIVLESLLVTGC